MAPDCFTRSADVVARRMKASGKGETGKETKPELEYHSNPMQLSRESRQDEEGRIVGEMTRPKISASDVQLLSTPPDADSWALIRQAYVDMSGRLEAMVAGNRALTEALEEGAKGPSRRLATAQSVRARSALRLEGVLPSPPAGGAFPSLLSPTSSGLGLLIPLRSLASFHRAPRGAEGEGLTPTGPWPGNDGGQPPARRVPSSRALGVRTTFEPTSGAVRRAPATFSEENPMNPGRT